MLLKAIVDTVIKKRPADSTTLSSSEKFSLSEGSTIEIQSYTRGESGHLRVVLKEPVGGETIWFAYERHVSILGRVGLGVQGADSYINVDSDFIIGGASRLLGGIKPAYWGRYFSGIDYTGGGEYRRRLENNVLRHNGIRVLPIGRFTTRVGLGKAEGTRDGRDQAEDLIVTFGEDYLRSQGGEFYFFLDVEPTHPLSTDYYMGWSEAVKKISSKVRVLPCVYLNSEDATTSNALKNAMRLGAECHGLWVARYGSRFRKPSIPLPPLEFDATEAKPKTDVPCPVLLWQYAGEIGAREDLDFNVTNPEIDYDLFLSRLVLPQRI
jgi:hypothetical protein